MGEALIAGSFMAATLSVIIAISLSLFEIIGHLCNFTKPYQQRYIIRILLMVPIYSLNALFALIWPVTGIYLDSSREVYESFVIYSFMKYLFNFLQYDTNLQQYIDHKPGPSHIFPLCFLPTCIGGRKFMVRCKHGILQYVIVRPITTLIAFISQQLDFYGEGNYNPMSGYTYPVLLIINNISQIIAMYCLVIFYTGYRHELDPMSPLAKFFSIKLVVFFSFFQYVLISGLIEIPIVESSLGAVFTDLHDKVSIIRRVQELLICFDMLVAAIGHLYAFPYKPFIEDDDMAQLVGEDSLGNQKHRSSTCCQALCSLMDFSDERSDVREHFGQIFDKIRQIFSINPPLPSIVTNNGLESDDWLVYGGSSSNQERGRIIPINQQVRSNGTM